MNKLILLSGMCAILFFFSTDYVLAHPHSEQVLINNHSHESQNEIIPLSGMAGIEKTTLLFHTLKDSVLPWAFVEGRIANHIEGYPVIIQIFKEDQPVHFAQTDTDPDGSYEYKFRVLNVDNGVSTKLFDGDYTVRIFKVVYLQGIV